LKVSGWQFAATALILFAVIYLNVRDLLLIKLNWQLPETLTALRRPRGGEHRSSGHAQSSAGSSGASRRRLYGISLPDVVRRSLLDRQLEAKQWRLATAASVVPSVSRRGDVATAFGGSP
jgi:hypothetical protein